MMLRAIAVLALFALTLVCASALAAETGRIEVEVVYKDTGEPIEGVLVAVERQRERDLHETLLCLLNGERAGTDGKYTFHAVGFATYDVLISNPLSGDEVEATPFYYGGSEVQKTITLSRDNLSAKVVFEVARGVRLCGSVTRQGGSPLAGGYVVVQQGQQPMGNAVGVVRDDGRFELLGVAPGPTARTQVYSPIQSGGRVVGFVPIHDQGVELGGEAAQADFVVTTAPLYLTLDVVKPAWPLSLWREARSHACVIWVGGKPEKKPRRPDVRVVLRALPCEATPGLPRERYRLHVSDVPANEKITIGLGTWFLGDTVRSSRHVHVGAEFRYRSWRTVQMADAPQALTVVMYEQYAGLSRVLWFGVPSVLVLAVCVTVLVRGARRRRAREGSG